MTEAFTVLNAIVRLIIMGLIAYKLMCFHEMLNRPERLGLGICGGTGFLTIPVIFAQGDYRTPFDGWASALFSIGFLIYLIGRTSRHIRHQRENDRAIEAARAHIERRGRP